MEQAIEQASSEDLSVAAELFRVLSSPVRLAIVQRLTDKSATVSDLVDHLGVSQPLISQHLRVLRAQRVVTSTTHGQFHTYEIADEHVSHIVGDAIDHAKETK